MYRPTPITSHAAAILVVMQVAWHEVVFIFRINRVVRAMGEIHYAKGLSSFSEAERKRLLEPLNWVESTACVPCACDVGWRMYISSCPPVKGITEQQVR
jgi:hypothetical protein